MLKKRLIRLHWFLSSQLGIDPRLLFNSLRGLPAYLRDRSVFRRSYTGEMSWMPCLHDRYADAGSTKSEYFWQDLLVARWIHDAQPLRHVDVGSRIDGFAAHVASFREIEVLDIRPINTKIPGIIFKQIDLTQPDPLPEASADYCDSLSCLHAIEHFGLGRYGDPIDPRGYERGIRNMAKLLKPGGRFYLSTPIGRERIEFNAHRIFDPRTIIDCAEANGLKLHQLTLVLPHGEVRTIQTNTTTLTNIAQQDYRLGIFIFLKLS